MAGIFCLLGFVEGLAECAGGRDGGVMFALREERKF